MFQTIYLWECVNCGEHALNLLSDYTPTHMADFNGRTSESASGFLHLVKKNCIINNEFRFKKILQ